MDIIVTQKFAANDKAIYPYESGGKTYFILVKIDDVAKIEKQTDDSYKVYYNVLVYQKAVVGGTTTYAQMIVEESKLQVPQDFMDTVVATF